MSINKHILFDLDGTLVDDNIRYIETFKQAFKMHHLKVSIDLDDILILRRLGFTEKDIFLYLKIPSEEMHRIHGTRVSFYETESFLDMQKLFVDSVKVLDMLSAKYKISIVTNRRDDVSLFAQLEKLGIIDKFDSVLCRNGKYRTKTEMFRSLSCKEECIFITDTVGDMLMSNAISGMETYGVSRGLDSHERLSAISYTTRNLLDLVTEKIWEK